MNIEELKRLAEAATPGPWVAAINTNMDNKVSHSFGDICQTGKDIGDAIFIAAANPVVVLELIAEMERLREDADDLTIALESSEKALKDSRANGYTAMGYLADCRVAVGDNGKRMLPEFVEYLKALKQQRDELLASLKEARELVEDWGAYAPAYMQEKHDLEGDLSRLDAVISKMETP